MECVVGEDGVHGVDHELPGTIFKIAECVGKV